MRNLRYEFSGIRSNFLCSVKSDIRTVESGICRSRENIYTLNIILFTGYPVSAGSFDKVHVFNIDIAGSIIIPTNYNTYGSLVVIVHIGTDNVGVYNSGIRDYYVGDIGRTVFLITNYTAEHTCVVSII